MAEPEFDAVAAGYRKQHEDSIRLSGESADFFAAYKIADVAAELARVAVSPRTILDFGCGIGESLDHLIARFPAADVHGVDVSGASVAMARQRCGGRATLAAYDGEHLPYADDSFDMIFTACVFHHIPETSHLLLLQEIRRILRPDGCFFLFEHNPWNPATRYAVAQCPFDANAVLISAPTMRRRIRAAGFTSARRRFRLFFPRLLQALRPLEAGLTWLPLGAQYYCVAHGKA